MKKIASHYRMLRKRKTPRPMPAVPQTTESPMLEAITDSSDTEEKGPERPAMSEGEMFQIFFAHKLDEFIEEKGLSKTKFGEKIFNTKSGGRIWRTTKDLDRRRHISVADCFYIAKALEKDLPSIVWQICQAASQVNLVEYVDKLWEEREE